MKLSVVIICWNDLAVIKECLRSVHAETTSIDLEVIVSDNGSEDGAFRRTGDDHFRRRHPCHG